MIKIDSFIKKNGSNSSSTNGGGFANGATTNTTTVQKELETHKLWGQNFNGTQDVDGDMAVNGNVSISGNVKATTGAITNIESESITNVGTITTDTVDATTIKGANANISNQLNIKDIISKDITTDYLTVTKSAHFWELVIDKISSTKGAIIVSPANCIVEDLTNNNGQYTLYWRAEDVETGKAITNDFKVYDQIVCQSFNAATDADFSASNKFYWRLVTNVGRTYRADSLRGGGCYWNYIQLSATDANGTSIPEIGDNIAVLGNRTNEDRQNAIIISSTNSDYLDADIQAPSIVQYKGIKSYDLKSYRYNVIAANGNTFIGNFKVVATDGTIGDIESGKDGKGIKSIVTHYLASNLKSGMGKTTVWDSGSVMPPTLTVTKPYMWQQAKTTYTDDTYTLSLPVMIGSLGKTGTNGIMDKLSMTKALAKVDINDNLYVYCEGYVNHIDGDRVTRVSDLSNYYFKIIDSTAGIIKNTPSANANMFWYSSLWQRKYSEQTNRITHFRLQLFDKSDNLLDEITFNVTFDAGAVLTVGQNAITASVQQSKNYTDGQISTVKQTADGIASRVTKIEGDYVTESEMNQTANNISLNVYDNLKNKTGIDVTTGKIVLNADNVQVKGNFNLTDTKNGLTIYDAANTPLINLQPKAISKIGTFTNDRLTSVYLTMTSVKGGSGIVVQTDKSRTINMKKGDVIRLTTIRYNLYAKNGTYTIYPKNITLSGGVRIYNSKGETVLNHKAQYAIKDLYGTYELNTSVSFRVTTDDNYTVNLFITTPTTWSTSYNVGGYGNTRIEIGNNVQSYIGSDGAFFHNAPNKMIYSAEDCLQLQYGFNGIRWNNDNKNFNKSMEVLCATKVNNDYTYSPLYLPFYNYVPTTSSFNYTSQYVKNIGATKYAHCIDVSEDVGILFVDMPALNDDGNYQETWFVLPESNIKIGNTYYDLPIGYVVKIINAQTRANVYVTVNTSSKGVGVIYTNESSKTTSLRLSGDNSMKTFMYIGGYGSESGATWRVID